MDKILNDKNISWFVAFIVVNNIIAFSFNLGGPYYVVMLFALLLLVMMDRIVHVSIKMSFFYLSCLLSIVLNDIPDLFNPWGRFASFLLITALVSPFIESHAFTRFRIRVFQYIQWLLHFVVFGSMFAYFAGISYGRVDFVGITNQSMLLAPVSACVILSAFYYLTSKKGVSLTWKVYYIGLFISAFLTLLLAASRTAIAGTLAAMLMYVLIVNKNHLQRFVKFLAGVAILLSLSYSLWSPYLENVNRKNENSIRAGGMTSSRDVHWKKRLKEFESSRFFGIGFSSIALNGMGANFNEDSGQIETGSSWLSILSMTGVLGLVTFLALLAGCLKSLWKLMRIDVKYASYLMALLVFWMAHMMAEGYIYAGGSFLSFNVWLLLGYIAVLGRKPLYLMAVR